MNRTSMETCVNCTYVGHATTIMEMAGERFLTDPHLSDRTHFFLRRQTPIPFDPKDLPEPTAILISSTARDHLNLSSFRYISSKAPVFVPVGAADSIAKLIGNAVIEIAPFATHVLPNGVEITAIPCRRSTSYLIRSAQTTIFFCGTAGYSHSFRDVGDHQNIDVAFLPIGDYAPRWLMQRWHLNPPKAIQAFEDMKARHLIPIGWGTFRFSLEPADAPVVWLKRLIAERPSLEGRVHILDHGKTFHLPRVAQATAVA